MPNPEEERAVGAMLEVVLRRDFGIAAGPMTVRDGRDGSRLRVDGTYDAVGIALEITGIHMDHMLKAHSEARKVADRLTEFARQHSLGGWYFSVSARADLKQVEAEVRDLLSRGCEIRPGHYTLADLQSRSDDEERSAFILLHRRLEGIGLQWLMRNQTDCVHMAALASGGGYQITGFGARLDSAIADNADKLAEARPWKTHLAVLVTAGDASNAPDETSPPQLPDAIDMLWVLHYGPGALKIWSLSRGATSWRLHEPAAV